MEGSPLLGIFDSGVGGFSVYKKIRKVSTIDCIYYGDCLRAPYGNREEAEILSFIKDDIKFLQDEGATYFVNACNSMSVVTTDRLLDECGVKKDMYTDMIRAFDIHATCEAGEKVLVLATIATIRSGIYQEVLAKKGASVEVYAYKDLAFAIENNASQSELLSIIEKGVVYAHEVGATRIVYGCTHYPLVHQLFLTAQENIGWKGNFIDPALYITKEIQKWGIQGERRFSPYTSKDTAAFIKNIAELF
jgi:glutamate racemase